MIPDKGLEEVTVGLYRTRDGGVAEVTKSVQPSCELYSVSGAFHKNTPPGEPVVILATRWTHHGRLFLSGQAAADLMYRIGDLTVVREEPPADDFEKSQVTPALKEASKAISGLFFEKVLEEAPEETSEKPVEEEVQNVDQHARERNFFFRKAT